jgi:aldehyde dehydrogenase (NAD+)
MAEIEPATGRTIIDGDFVDGGAGRIVVTDPATGEAARRTGLADAADVDRAVQAAAACHLSGALSRCARSSAAAWCRRWGVICWSTRIDEIALS